MRERNPSRVAAAIAVRPRSAIAITLASALGVVAFCWPFVVVPGTFSSTETPPLMYRPGRH
jgi:energy-coupling factor transport system substrate-specific component